MNAISDSEYLLMKQYIEKDCGVYIEDVKESLIEIRLSDITIEVGANTYIELQKKASQDKTGKLRERIIEAITTNETCWFRDDSAWSFIRGIQVPKLLDLAKSGETVRIWSTAVSTGQELYSLLMLLHEGAVKLDDESLLDNFEFLGTDISSSALFPAISGRYNQISMNRGIPDSYRNRYFTKTGNVWSFNETLRKKASFRRFNLEDDFNPLGQFDFVLCRYVAMYYSDIFKRRLYRKLASAVKSDGILLLGATESLEKYSDDFTVETHMDCVVNRRK